MSSIERQYCLVRLRLEDDAFLSVDAIYPNYEEALRMRQKHNAYVAPAGEYYTIWPVVMEA